MKIYPILSSVACVLLALATQVMAQTTVTTPTVGFVTGTCKAGSDTVLSVPFSQPPVFVGTVSGSLNIVSTSATVTATVTSGSTGPAWTTNQFASLYYVKFSSGALSGKLYTITANDAGTITFYTENDNVTGAVAGDAFSVVKYWTLGDLFQPGVQTAIVPSANRLQIKSKVGIPNTTGTGTGVGINLAINQWFILVGTGTSGKWQSTPNGVDATNQLLYPDTYFVVRHTPGQVTADTTYTFTGQVSYDRAVTPLLTGSAAKQDNFVAVQRPVALTLSQLFNVTGSTGFVQSKNRLQTADQLLLFDNTTSGINKAPSSPLIMVSGTWMNLSGSNANNVTLQPGMGFIVRKAPVVGGTTAFWANDPTYSN